jgi:hypothetical protein
MKRGEQTMTTPGRVAVGALATIHALGVIGAPFAAKLHLFQPGASAHQDFHVIWEACKYFGASALALAIVVGPLARSERWAWWAMAVATLALFGGVFFSDAITRGAPAIDHWAYGTFLVVSSIALAALAAPVFATRSDHAPRVHAAPTVAAAGIDAAADANAAATSIARSR